MPNRMGIVLGIILGWSASIPDAQAADYCISEVHVPGTIKAAQQSGWQCSAPCPPEEARFASPYAQIQNDIHPDKIWDDYKFGQICQIFISQKGRQTRAKYGNSIACFYNYTISSAGPCLPGDVLLKSDTAPTR